MRWRTDLSEYKERFPALKSSPHKACTKADRDRARLEPKWNCKQFETFIPGIYSMMTEFDPPFGIDIYTHTYALNVYWSWLQVALTLLQGWHIEVQLLLDSNPHRQRPFDFWRCLKANTVGEFIWKATKRVRRSGSIFPLDCKVSFLPPREKRRAVLAWLAGMKQFVSAGQTGRLRSLAFGMTPESLSAWLPERIEDRLQMSGSPNCLAFM